MTTRTTRRHLTSGLIGAFAALALCAMLGLTRWGGTPPTSPNTSLWLTTNSNDGRQVYLWRCWQALGGKWQLECVGEGAVK